MVILLSRATLASSAFRRQPSASLGRVRQLWPYRARQTASQLMAKADFRLEVEGRVALNTVRSTGMLTLRLVAVTVMDPEYLPGDAPCGTRTSTQATRFSPAGTVIGKAFRAWP